MLQLEDRGHCGYAFAALMRTVGPTLRFLLAAGLLVGATSILHGCGVAVGAGAAAGTASMQERGLGGTFDDKLIQTKLNAALIEHSAGLFVNLSTEVQEGRVLLTGNVTKPESRIDAVRVAWQIDGVREVINQIEINDKAGVLDYARDAWISSRLTVKLTVDNRVKAINYSVDTVNGHVFLMGVAQNEAELERVKAHASEVPSVRRVTSYVLMKDDPARGLNVVIPGEPKAR